ncbi:glycoside hydrolase family 5 protein [Cucurbitaria berberidis CBS 394.84]|uniref:cellulase n=1 Tax=Cucurbitaria berberidis CBS 394.84 TaxID=1168544 RepID=A0A9P4GRF0_9PLEO|nr:glycoside hydrolase family 5 protein [Cucurbitaria berberidis CBS 394.84]KAF1850442.1 glycoside hydrolase family 5 protein [Cucurbitaria berberidis CBS 394.84]
MIAKAVFGVIATAALLVSQGATEILYAGVNSAGGEFAQQNLPGAFGIDYQFINETSIDFFLRAGVNTIRIPFLLERMCPLATGLGSTFNETYFSEFKNAVNYITAKGGYVVLDAHNYMRYNDPSSQPSSGSIIGNTSDPKAATTSNLATFWTALSTRFITNPNVIYGIMNEPHDMPTSLILQNNQAAINAIRTTGARQLILVPGNGFSGAQRWLNRTCSNSTADCAPNGDVLTQITDPGKNFAFDMHLYFDNDTSGTHEACTLAAPSNLRPVTTWLQQHNYTAFLSEFGAGSSADPTCAKTLNDTLGFLEGSDRWIGWTYWAAGPLWGNEYFLSVEPGEGKQANSTWPDVLAPRVKAYQPMVRCGVSTSVGEMAGEGARRERGEQGCLGLKLPG